MHPNDLIVDKFQSWDKTKDSRPKLKARNRAKKCVSDLIMVIYDPPSGHGLRVVDKDSALQFLITNMFEGTSFEDFLRLCMIPPEATALNSSDTTLMITEITEPENDTEFSSKAFTSVDSVHEGKKPFKCVTCNYSCDLESSLQQHVSSVHEGKKPFKCDTCNYSSDVREELQQHVASVHEVKKQSKRESASQKAGKICKSTWLGVKCQIKDCVQVHIEPCPDQECQAQDGGLPLYKARNCQLWHVRSKTKKKKYKVDKKELKKHSGSVHEGKKPFNCESCDNSSTLKGNKKKHIGSVHEVKKPLKSSQTWNSRVSTHTSHKNVNFGKQTPNNGGQPKNTFRPAPSNKLSYSSVVTGQVSPISSGNKPAAAAFQPRTRGGIPNMQWGQKMDQIQMITEIMMQVMQMNQ